MGPFLVFKFFFFAQRNEKDSKHQLAPVDSTLIEMPMDQDFYTCDPMEIEIVENVCKLKYPTQNFLFMKYFFMDLQKNLNR